MKYKVRLKLEAFVEVEVEADNEFIAGENAEANATNETFFDPHKPEIEYDVTVDDVVPAVV